MEIKSTKVLIVGCGQLGFSVAKNIDPHIFKLYGFSRSLKKSPPSIEMHQVDILKIASDYEISGGFINNAVQFAWLNARKNNSKMITNQDVLLGIKREYAKEGKIFNN